MWGVVSWTGFSKGLPVCWDRFLLVLTQESLGIMMYLDSDFLNSFHMFSHNC